MVKLEGWELKLKIANARAFCVPVQINCEPLASIVMFEKMIGVAVGPNGFPASSTI
jgi:hypothetical protein